MVGGESKVVATGVHKASIKLTDLNTASFSTLRGISDLGFKVGNRFYQYTITGFEQDYLTSGTATVRLFTSRGDSIYITSTAASLEKVSGKKIDIAAATLAGKRHLLQNANDLVTLDADDVLASSGNVQTTSTVTTDLTAEQIAAMAGAGTTSDDDASNGNRAYNIMCPEGLVQAGTSENPHCKCLQGYTGASATFDGTTDMWIMTGTCAIVIPPEESNIQVGYYTDQLMATASCGMGYKGSPEWDFATGKYMGKCVAGITPTGLIARPYVMEQSEGTFKSKIKEIYMGCPKGFKVDEQNPITFDFMAGKWNGGCVAAACPENSALNNTSMTCECKPGYYGPGHTWDDSQTGSGRWSIDAASFCNEKMAGLIYDCAGPNVASDGTPDCPAVAAPLPDHAEITNGWTSGANFPVGISCKAGYEQKPLLSWAKKDDQWIGACLVKPCFPNSVKMTENGELRCECKDTYMLEGTGDWNTEAQKFDGKCVKVACPANSANELGSQNGPYYYKAADDECVCAPGYTGTGYIWDSGTTMFLGKELTSVQNQTGVKKGCKKMACPVTMVDDTQGADFLSCTCPALGFHEKKDPIDGQFGMSVRNDVWTFVGTCEKPACPANTIQVDGEGADKNSYCKCDTAKGYKGKVNWWYPAQKEFIDKLIATEAEARAKVASENQKQQWYPNCTLIPCPDSTKRVGNKCVCGAGTTGQVTLDMSTKTYSATCNEVIFDDIMKDFDATSGDWPTAHCNNGMKPAVKAPFQWNYATQKYAAKDNINKAAVCAKVPCPTGTYDTDLTFEDDGVGCVCKQGGTKMTYTYELMTYEKYAGWNAPTAAYLLTKAACS